MKRLALIAAVLPALMVLGFTAQGQLAAAVACLWVVAGMVVFAFRPTGGERDRRIRFSLADLVLLTTLIAVSLGILSNQARIAEWLKIDASSRSE
jgi:hypothetical protein